MEWTTLPAKNFKKLLFFISVLLLCFFILWIGFGIYFGILSVLVLVGVNFSFLTKTMYKIGDNGITVKKPFYTIFKDWNWIKRIELDKNGVFLSPFEKRNFLDPFRGIFLISNDAENVYNEILKIKNGRTKRESPETPFRDRKNSKSSRKKKR